MVGAAVVLRVGQYLSNKSLWLDEANLGLEIMRRPFSAALHPIGQIAPAVHVGVKAVTLFGDSELHPARAPAVRHRLVVLFYFVASRYLDWRRAFLPSAVRRSDRPIYYPPAEAIFDGSGVALLCAWRWRMRFIGIHVA